MQRGAAGFPGVQANPHAVSPASRFGLGCNAKEKSTGASMDVGPDESAGDAAAASAGKPSLDCYPVVVPGFKDVAGVLTDMRRGIAARRTGPLDCALIRYG